MRIGGGEQAKNSSTGDGVGAQGTVLCVKLIAHRTVPCVMSDSTGNWPQWLKNTIKKVATNIVKPFVTSAQQTLSGIDATYSFGINVSGTPSGFIFNGQVGVSIDTKGNVAIQSSSGGGITGGSPGISVTGYRSITNAPSINKLNEFGCQMGGSLGIPVGAVPVAIGGDFNIIPDDTLGRTYLGVTGNLGFGTPGGEFHTEWGSTTTWDFTQFNIFDVAENVYSKIMEW